ncbi:MAG: transaldolase family protein, partial [Syntrophaceae bacterium]
MKFFIDSANISEIKEALSLGMCDGVTTNPSLVAREKRPFNDVVKEILEAVP